MRALKWLAGVVAFAVLASLAIVASLRWEDRTTAQEQGTLASFYADPSPMPVVAGTLVRSEPLTQADGTPVRLAGASAWRMLYASQRPDGAIAVSGAMVFIPAAPAPAAGRPVLAWAHGTVGQGDACAPSRSADPLKPIASWLPIALARGWAVVATDYTGLGTTGPNLYLVGEAEAADVVHSIRAARGLPSASLSSRTVVMGHSQGGHSALWAGHRASSLDPSIELLGVAAIAPAAELDAIIGAQWRTPVSWVIGPEIMNSWPVVDPALPASILSESAVAQGSRITQACIANAAIEGLVRTKLGEAYFTSDPAQSEPWAALADRQTPAPLPAALPVLLAQSTADDVVLAWPNAQLQQRWCAAGSNLAATWIAEVSHIQTALVVGPSVMDWAQARFDGQSQTSTCAVPPPIAVPSGS